MPPFQATDKVEVLPSLKITPTVAGKFKVVRAVPLATLISGIGIVEETIITGNAVWVYVIKEVKCLVQTIRSVPLSNLQSPPAGKASPAVWVSAEHRVVMGVKTPPRDHPMSWPVCPANKRRAAGLSVRGVSPAPTAIADVVEAV